MEGASQRRAAAMVRASSRHVKAAVSAQLGAQTEIDVLAIGEKILVEAADILKQTRPVKRGRGARTKHRPRLVILACIQFPISHAVSAASQQNFVSHTVQIAWIGPPQKLRNGGTISAILLERLN